MLNQHFLEVTEDVTPLYPIITWEKGVISFNCDATGKGNLGETGTGGLTT